MREQGVICYLFHVVHDALEAFLPGWVPAQHHVVLGRFGHLQLKRSAGDDALWRPNGNELGP